MSTRIFQPVRVDDRDGTISIDGRRYWSTALTILKGEEVRVEFPSGDDFLQVWTKGRTQHLCFASLIEAMPDGSQPDSFDAALLAEVRAAVAEEEAQRTAYIERIRDHRRATSSGNSLQDRAPLLMPGIAGKPWKHRFLPKIQIEWTGSAVQLRIGRHMMLLSKNSAVRFRQQPSRGWIRAGFEGCPGSVNRRANGTPDRRPKGTPLRHDDTFKPGASFALVVA